MLRAEGGKKVHPEYEQMIRNAELAFCHQRIFDTVRHCITCLTPLPEGSDNLSQEWDFLGPLIPNEQALLIAKGKICPMTHEPFVNDIPKPISTSLVSMTTVTESTAVRVTSKYEIKYPKHYSAKLPSPSSSTSSYMSNPYIKELGKPRVIKVKSSSPPVALALPGGQKTIRDFFAPRTQDV